MGDVTRLPVRGGGGGSAGYSGTDEAWVSYGGSPAGGGKTVIHWQVTDRATGTALTYTSDGTNGDSITVNTDGIYAVQISGQCITTTTDFYCTRNITAGEKTNPPYFVSNAKVLCTSTVNSNIQSAMYVGHLAAGDVLYTQTDANADQIVADRYLFWRVTRIA